LINDRIGLSVSDLAEVKKTSGAYGIEEQPFAATKQGGVYAFRHPEHPRKSDWTFVLDWHWNKGWVRFHRRFVEELQAAELVVDAQRGGGKNCSVKYEDLRKALDLCCASTSR